MATDETGASRERPAAALPTVAAPLHLDQAELSSVLHRLKRAQGQVGGVIRMIEDGRNCAEILTQLAAASKALDRVGFAVIGASVRQCLSEDPASRPGGLSSLEKLFLSLA